MEVVSKVSFSVIVLLRHTSAFLLKMPRCIHKTKKHMFSYSYYALVSHFVVYNTDSIIRFTHRSTLFVYATLVLYNFMYALMLFEFMCALMLV
jgi:hypothetical protein